MRVLGVIPARGGSKGVPRKNVRLLGGKPLLQWTAEAALSARRITRVVLSTDDEEIAELGRRCGVEVPFLRPAELAQDNTPMFPVVEHAVRWADTNGECIDAVCLLQPTTPLRRSEDIDSCIDLLDRLMADTVLSVLPVPAEHNPHWVYVEAGDGAIRLATREATPIPRRQDLPPAWHRDGAVYVTRRDVVMQGGSLYGPRVVGYPMDPSRHVNIDEPADWERAEALVAAIASAGAA
jgi:CMP-N-acetylneuraminic acid synthetase